MPCPPCTSREPPVTPAISPPARQPGCQPPGRQPASPPARPAVRPSGVRARADPPRRSQEWDERFLLVPLVTAERAWGYAMQLKFEMVDEPRKRFHMLKRLAAAARAAHELRKICTLYADEKTILEAEAYAGFMLGNVLLEKGRWGTAMGRLSKAQALYLELSKMQKTDDQRKLFARMANGASTKSPASDSSQLPSPCASVPRQRVAVAQMWVLS